MELPDFTRAMVLLGRDDAGELQIVGLDAVGRISAFVIDSRDAWGRMLSVGNAELAVRLGSAVAYDRRGQVAFFEDFETGVGAWTFDKDGTLGAGALDPTTSLSGGYSYRLTGGSNGDRWASISMTRGLAQVGRMGLEFAVAWGTDFDYVVGSLILGDGTREYLAQIRYDFDDEDLEVYNDLGAWVSVLDAAFSGTTKKAYNVLKFVIDTDSQKYERLLFNDQEVNLSDHSYEDVGLTAGEYTTVEIACYSHPFDNDVVYVDDIILTLAEPAN